MRSHGGVSSCFSVAANAPMGPGRGPPGRRQERLARARRNVAARDERELPKAANAALRTAFSWRCMSSSPRPPGRQSVSDGSEHGVVRMAPLLGAPALLRERGVDAVGTAGRTGHGSRHFRRPGPPHPLPQRSRSRAALRRCHRMPAFRPAAGAADEAVVAGYSWRTDAAVTDGTGGAAQPGPAHASADPRRRAHARHRRRSCALRICRLPARRSRAEAGLRRGIGLRVQHPSRSVRPRLVAQRSVVLVCPAQGHPPLSALLQGTASLRCRQQRDRLQEDLAGPGLARP